MFDFNKWKSGMQGKMSVNDIQSNLDNLEKDISRNLLPTLVELNSAMEVPFASKFCVEMSKEIAEDLKRLKYKVNGRDAHGLETIDIMIYTATQMLSIIPWIRGQFKSKDINVEAMELRTSNLLQMIELAEFSFDFMMNFANVITHYELTENGSGASKLTPTIEEKVTLNRWAFVLATTVLGREVNDIKSAYGRVPALLADSEKFYDLMQSVGRSQADPLNLSAPPFPLSLIFYARMGIANWQMDRLEKSEATAKAVSYRLALLKRQRSGEGSDAAIETQIEAYESRLAKVQRKIAKAEKAYGLEGA